MQPYALGAACEALNFRGYRQSQSPESNHSLRHHTEAKLVA